jgi:hypothetical protein
MRFLEILFKIIFAAGAAFFIYTIPGSDDGLGILLLGLIPFLAACVILGILLIFNKHSSYDNIQTNTDLIIRKIEGIILVIFGLASIHFITLKAFIQNLFSSI